ncbi:hypothetical protein RM190_21140 [Paracoccus sp. CPCC 101403]|uniref:Uncharacterized protein n=1 Tax=Paracoccus broussonetiae TaxID=3075834 RepID=A0ABU3EJF6_9RHOB|nr:hypothetical protein [Paracoccus sp. CPCC 101403]MDT1064380.1 hypothetical protein [Paracoccus sp. CPCC 101403]
MTKIIEVIDALPGTGKSTAVFKWMKARDDAKYIYVSPLLTEVTVRVQREVPELRFKSPEGYSKSVDLLKLLEDGENISCTHALFLRMGEAHWKVIKDQNYEVVLDEEIAVIEKFNQGRKGDLPLLISLGQCSIEGPYSKVTMNGNADSFKASSLDEVVEAARQGILYTSKSEGQRDFLVTQVPISLLLAAKRVTVLTYMFEGSILHRFLELHNVGWRTLNLPLHKTNEEVIGILKERINFKSTRAIEALSKFSLSASWYEKAERTRLDKVGDALRSVSRSVPDEKLLTTLPKTNAEKGAKYVGNKKMRAVKNSWLWAGTRATNDHANKNVVVHLYNRYPNANVKAYFQSHGFPVDDDHFALSELIQFVFRSALRNGESIDLYIASPRMKKLLVDWLSAKELEFPGVLEAA